MNRFLVFPLCISLLGFGVFYAVQPTAATAKVNRMNINRVASKKVAAQPLSVAEVETLVLDGWPTLDPSMRFYRVLPRQKLYAEIGQLAQEGEGQEDADYFLCSLYVHVPSHKIRQVASGGLAIPRTDFPLHIDRYTGNVQIYDEFQWTDYASWRNEKLPYFKEISGWQEQGAKEDETNLSQL